MTNASALHKIDYVKILGISVAQAIVKKFKNKKSSGYGSYFEAKVVDKKEIEKLNHHIASILHTVITDWSDGTDNSTASAMVAVRPVLNKLKPVKPDVFKTNPSKYKLAYRGAEVKEAKLKKFVLTHKKSKDWKVASINGSSYMVFISKKLQYKSHRLVQSWSVDPSDAQGFNSTTILIAPVNVDDFYFDPKFMNAMGHTENEVVHFGNNLKTYIAIEKDTYEDIIYDNSKYPDIKKLKFKENIEPNGTN